MPRVRRNELPREFSLVDVTAALLVRAGDVAMAIVIVKIILRVKPCCISSLESATYPQFIRLV